jgi:VanZ family protein
MTAPARDARLSRVLVALYVLLVVYASLYPLTGWRDHGGSAFEFLGAPWPRQVLVFDAIANVAAYALLGLLAVLAWRPRLRGAASVLGATVLGALLSLALEAAQSYLPARAPSALDVLCNAAGAFLGALAGQRATPWEAPLRAWRARALQAGTHADLGLTLLGLWLFTQLNPAMLLFGVGDLRDLFVGPAGPARAPELFVAIEAVTAAANLSAVALLVSAIATPGAPVRAMVVALVLVALAVKTFAFAVILRAQDGLDWITPGAVQGLAAGLAVALLAVGLPRVARLTLAAVLLMAAAVLVNLAPQNPYMALMLKLWQQGHFLNFNGLTRVVATLWPFAATGFLIHLAARRREGATG